MRKASRLMKASTMLALVLALGLVIAPSASALAQSAPVPVHRFYNQGTGSHFYTISEEEKQSVMAKYADAFAYEGIAYYAPDPTMPVAEAGAEIDEPTVPLFRFFNVKNGGHFYTISAAERDRVIATYPGIFVYEGIAYEVWAQPGSGYEAPVYRFYNRLNGSHFYTISDVEANLAKIKLNAVYQYEGVAFYAWPWRSST